MGRQDRSWTRSGSFDPEGNTTHRRIVRCWFIAKPGQIESNIDLPHQVILRNRVAKTKLVEQLTLVTFQGPSWIDLTEIRVSTTESRVAACLN